MDEWHLLIWSSIGTMLAVLPLLAEKDIRDETFEFFGGGGARPNGAILLEVVFDFMGRLFSIFAFVRTCSTSLRCRTAHDELICILVLSQFVPGILEDIDRRTLTLKFIACAIVVLGVYLVT